MGNIVYNERILVTIEANLGAFLNKKGVNSRIISSTGTFPLKKINLKLEGKSEIAHITKISKDIGLCLQSLEAPIIIPEYKTGTVRLEFVFGDHPIVDFHKTIKEVNFKECALPLLLGTRDITNPLVLDLQELPHLLIGGTTGSGKSMMLHSAINSLMFKAKERNIEFSLFDPKQVEFIPYEDSIYLTDSKIHTDPKDSLQVIQNAIKEMDDRLLLLKKAKCRDAKEFRTKYLEKMLVGSTVDAETLSTVATETKGFSMAFMKMIYETSAVISLQRDSRDKNFTISNEDLLAGLKQTKSYYVESETVSERKTGFGV